MQTVIMPKLGLTMEEGTIIRWLKDEGDLIEKGEILFEVETDKSVNEVESSAAGTLGKIFYAAGDVLDVLTIIGYILEPGEATPEEWPHPVSLDEKPKKQPAVREIETPTRATPVAQKIARQNGIDLSKVQGTGERGIITKDDVLMAAEKEEPGAPREKAKIKASPRAKKLAQKKGIDLALVIGSGPGGRITEEDVKAFSPSQDLLQPSRIQQITAERMAESFSTIPHFYLRIEVDASKLVETRRVLMPYIEAKTGVRITYTDILVLLVSKALRKHPLVNASWVDGAIRQEKDVNLSLAIAVDDGLFVPVIKNADQKSLEQIGAERKNLTQKAVDGKLNHTDLENGTFTLTNLGMFDIDDFDAIINPPQSAVLAVGKIADRVVPEDGLPVVKATIRLSLSTDHRVLDGAAAARFLGDLKQMVETPGDILSADNSNKPGE